MCILLHTHMEAFAEVLLTIDKSMQKHPFQMDLNMKYLSLRLHVYLSLK